MVKSIKYKLGNGKQAQPDNSILFVADNINKKRALSVDMYVDSNILACPGLNIFLSVIISSIRKYAEENDITILIDPLTDKEK